MYYSISQVAEKCGFSAHTLRYYDKEGLLPFVERTRSGVRKFRETDLEWLATITSLKDTGMSVKQIRRFVDLCREQDREALEERYQIFIEHKHSIAAQIAVLNDYMGKLQAKINDYQQVLQQTTQTAQMSKVT